MNKISGSTLLLACALLSGLAQRAAGQRMGMAMPMQTLLVAQLDGKQVIPGTSSGATGTGAFLLDPERHTVEYSLTYQGLEGGGAKSIALYNFGQGKNGDVVKELCGADTQPCPAGNAATISGNFDRGDTRALDNNLIAEFDSERVYVEIVGGDGRTEIRGQLAPNSAMVPFTNYVAHLAPMVGTRGSGSGTAILSEVHLPGGQVSVFYVATVAGTSGAPTNALLMGVPTKPARKARAFTMRMALPALKLQKPRAGATGGTLSGLYRVDSAKRNAPLAMKLLSAGDKEVGIAVTTSRFPNGELYGAFTPVH